MIMMTTTTGTMTSSAVRASSSILHDSDGQTRIHSTSTTTDGATSKTVVGTSRNISIVQAPPKVGTVKERIQMFGGDEVPKPEPTLVQKRRDQLST